MKKTLLLLFAIMAFGLSGCDHNPLPAQTKTSDAGAPLKGCDMAIFDEGNVTFYNSRTNSLIPFADEQDRVINGVFLNVNEFYYTVVIDDELYLKKVDLLASHPAPVMLTDWDLKLSDCFVDSCGYAAMSSYSNVPMIGIQHNMAETEMFCEFQDDRFYLPDDNTKSEGWPDEINMGDGADEREIQLLNDQDLFKQEEVEVEGADEDKSYYYYVPDASGDEQICISDKIDFESFKTEYSYEPQFELLGLNPQRDCVAYSALIDWGHVGHGPLCFATLDGKVQKALYYDCQEACYGWLANGKLAFSDEDGIKTVSPDGTIKKICSGDKFVTVY